MNGLVTAGSPAPTLLPFDNSYARLPERFFARVAPTPVAAPRLIRLNAGLAEELGLRETDSALLAQIFAGNLVPAAAEPIALAYAGHQFGGFTPQLGDGRAVLLGEVVDRDGRRRDIQLKGSGPTPFSRRGDGRAALGPVLREYVVSEAMHALGIPTARTLAAVTTGEGVWRETPQPGGVVVRVAASHMRIGTFQYFAARQDREALELLTRHALARHYPEVATAERPALALLEGVIARQAALVARWMQVGFIHGVMNTDNMTISGETIDYGPCAFLDEYDPAKVFSSIDQHGRYAYANQPNIALWNLTRLAEALLPLMDANEEQAVKLAEEALGRFRPLFADAWLAGMRRKFGLKTIQDGDADLISRFLDLLHGAGADFTLAFRHLCDAEHTAGALLYFFTDQAKPNAWLADWRVRLSREHGDAVDRRTAMCSVNPAFIPRNHRIEEAIKAAVEGDDFGPFHTLVDILARPFEDQPDHAAHADPPSPDERVTRTFCGT